MNAEPILANKPLKKPSGGRKRAKAGAERVRPSDDPELLATIRRLLDLPMERRMHFLRVKLPGGGSCL